MKEGEKIQNVEVNKILASSVELIFGGEKKKYTKWTDIILWIPAHTEPLIPEHIEPPIPVHVEPPLLKGEYYSGAYWATPASDIPAYWATCGGLDLMQKAYRFVA